MADLSDVSDALVALLAGAVYPQGTAAPSVIGAGVKIFTGWPLPADLDADLADDLVTISVFPPPNLERVTTRFMTEWHQAAEPVHTIVSTVSASGLLVTLSGAVATPQYVSLIVNDKAYSLAVQAGDSLATLAAGLATLINADTPATSLGAAISIPGAYRLTARVGAPAPLLNEVERTQRSFVITVWAPTPALRTIAGRVARAALASRAFLPLADGSAGALAYGRTDDMDTNQESGIYRRDISYWIEYGQFLVDEGFEVTLPQLNIAPQDIAGAPSPAPKISYS